MSNKFTFNSDSLQVKGPKKTDGSFSVTFETGEYEAVNVAKLLAIPNQTALKVTLEILDGRPSADKQSRSTPKV